MSKIHVELGGPSALFVFAKQNHLIEMLRGQLITTAGSKQENSSLLVRDAVVALRKEVVSSQWVYVDSLMKQFGCDIPDIFQAPISASQPIIVTTPEKFFGEDNPPGMVVSPLAAICLVDVIEVVLVLREGSAPVFAEDVLRSLSSFFKKHADNTLPILHEETVVKMATRISSALDVGKVSVRGTPFTLSVAQRAATAAAKPSARSSPSNVAKGSSGKASQTLGGFRWNAS